MRRNFGDNLYHAHTTRSEIWCITHVIALSQLISLGRRRKQKQTDIVQQVAIVTLEGDTSRKVVRRCVQHGLFVLEQELEENLFDKLR